MTSTLKKTKLHHCSDTCLDVNTTDIGLRPRNCRYTHCKISGEIVNLKYVLNLYLYLKGRIDDVVSLICWRLWMY